MKKLIALFASVAVLFAVSCPTVSSAESEKADVEHKIFGDCGRENSNPNQFPNWPHVILASSWSSALVVMVASGVELMIHGNTPTYKVLGNTTLGLLGLTGTIMLSVSIVDTIRGQE